MLLCYKMDHTDTDTMESYILIVYAGTGWGLLIRE